MNLPSASRVHEIRLLAQETLKRLWKGRHEFWEVPPMSRDQMFPVDVNRIVRGVLGYELATPEEFLAEGGTPAPEIAGVVDPEAEFIAVAQRYPPDWVRFTTAHEIGHARLHPHIGHLRERPMGGAERVGNVERALEEVEADVFAAELLMPKRTFTKVFVALFGGPLKLSDPSPELLAAFEFGVGKPGVGKQLLRHGLRFGAMHLAATERWGGRVHAAVRTVFGVSQTAAAIRMEELGLAR